MDQQPPAVAPSIARRAADAAAQAARLRQAARTLRQLAGTIKYHPATGQRPVPTAALTGALEALTLVLNEIQRDAVERSRDEAAVAALDDAAAARVRFGHMAVDQGAQFTAAAVEVLWGMLTSSDDATLDAPYGHGAPKRPHPGALSTVVAERAEHLATALETVTILKANLSSDR